MRLIRRAFISEWYKATANKLAVILVLLLIAGGMCLVLFSRSGLLFNYPKDIDEDRIEFLNSVDSAVQGLEIEIDALLDKGASKTEIQEIERQIELLRFYKKTGTFGGDYSNIAVNPENFLWTYSGTGRMVYSLNLMYYPLILLSIILAVLTFSAEYSKDTMKSLYMFQNRRHIFAGKLLYVLSAITLLFIACGIFIIIPGLTEISARTVIYGFGGFTAISAVAGVLLKLLGCYLMALLFASVAVLIGEYSKKPYLSLFYSALSSAVAFGIFFLAFGLFFGKNINAAFSMHYLMPHTYFMYMHFILPANLNSYMGYFTFNAQTLILHIESLALSALLMFFALKKFNKQQL